MQSVFASLLGLHLLCAAFFLILVRSSSVRIDEEPRPEPERELHLFSSIPER